VVDTVNYIGLVLQVAVPRCAASCSVDCIFHTSGRRRKSIWFTFFQHWDSSAHSWT